MSNVHAVSFVILFCSKGQSHRVSLQAVGLSLSILNMWWQVTFVIWMVSFVSIFLLVVLSTENSSNYNTKPVVLSNSTKTSLLSQKITVLENKIKSQQQLYNVLKLQILGMNDKIVKIQNAGNRVNKKVIFHQKNSQIEATEYPDYEKTEELLETPLHFIENWIKF